MSALNRDQIIERLKKGDLYVAPIFPVTKPGMKPEDTKGKQIGPASIDLRLGTVAMTARARGVSHVDPRVYQSLAKLKPHAFEETKQQKLDRYDVPFNSPLLVHPGQLTLVSTLEWVETPPDLLGYVTARSSWAREGLNIATATLINPCYRGVITLELSNTGHIPVKLFPGMRIAQLAFHEITLPKGSTKPAKSQFDLSFEPESGRFWEGDEEFIPPVDEEPGL